MSTESKEFQQNLLVFFKSLNDNELRVAVNTGVYRKKHK